jgi:hypothetical protein
LPIHHVIRSAPVFTIHRETILDPSLSPTARLLYAVLLASLDGDMGLGEVARLVGLKDTADLRPHLDELASVGAVDLKDHEGQGPVLTVHELPVVPEQRTHACIPCEDCGECSCEYIRGLCQA